MHCIDLFRNKLTDGHFSFQFLTIYLDQDDTLRAAQLENTQTMWSQTRQTSCDAQTYAICFTVTVNTADRTVHMARSQL